MATFLKTSFVYCGLELFLKGELYFEMRTLSPTLNLGFLSSCKGLLFRMDKKSEFFTFLVPSLSNTFFENLVL